MVKSFQSEFVEELRNISFRNKYISFIRAVATWGKRV